MSDAVDPEPSYRKSSRSQPNQGECVEVAGIAGGHAVRDSGRREGPVLVFGTSAWHALLTVLRRGSRAPRPRIGVPRRPVPASCRPTAGERGRCDGGLIR
ncbi:DUF397 domain-containing protein [Nocardiopsis lambiniae]|uniref:DUF397 domain-containing protein n=1 Tax=Nocardiopsis lambiniae TaxID=3075539 RepID=A0ABU2MH95_9ACTN|nr:DUF397 domain-containing protein [Nocardiopsis sp. DSM 44743]MDT0332089.1 DUF397 domain-containing protein [Nocardiopsis sp. DSM 44743]